MLSENLSLYMSRAIKCGHLSVLDMTSTTAGKLLQHRLNGIKSCMYCGQTVAMQCNAMLSLVKERFCCHKGAELKTDKQHLAKVTLHAAV